MSKSDVTIEKIDELKAESANTSEIKDAETEGSCGCGNGGCC